MNINFEEIKKQEVSNETLIHIIEVLYNEVKSSTTPNIILNELVDNLEPDSSESSSFSFTLSEKPMSPNDISIVTTDGSIIITPSSITKIEGDKVHFKNLQINQEMELFVTYKY
ncbi:MAG: hypothetical protein ACRCXX_14285 [Cetobacterium sp.]|uniref:hypothetical protein n=1 Tax=Cetobacterium sp. TaxID=2071632 RepID=UPI003F37BBC5